MTLCANAAASSSIHQCTGPRNRDGDGGGVQDVWCKLLLSGEKTEETRRYALPAELLGAQEVGQKVLTALQNELKVRCMIEAQR